MNKKIFLSLFIILVILGYLVYTGYIWLNIPNSEIYKIKGIDVSEYQGKIDWSKVVNDYKFAYLKATEADILVDKEYKRNTIEARKNNIKFGAYHFYHFGTDGISQAKFFINVIGNDFDLPPVLDIEFGGNSKLKDKNQTIKEIRDCINYLENYYHKNVIIYATQESYNELIQGNFANPIWFRSIIFNVDNNLDNLTFWQYNSHGHVNGINGYVDLNVFKGDLNQLEKL